MLNLSDWSEVEVKWDFSSNQAGNVGSISSLHLWPTVLAYCELEEHLKDAQPFSSDISLLSAF